MNELLLGLFMWVCANMNVDPKTVEPPIFQPVSVVRMAELMCEPKAKECLLSPALFDGKNFYVIEEVDYTASKEARSVVIHHLVHYVQFMKAKKNASEMLKNMAPNEEQAVDLQMLYLSLVEI